MNRAFKNLLPLATLVAFLGVLVLLPAAAQATGTPNITLTQSEPKTVLFGQDATVSLTAANPAGQPTGYNLSFQEVLPVGVSYVAGSSPIAPRIINNAPTTGKTTLIFDNVSDLSPGSSYTLSFKVRHSTVTPFGVGTTYTDTAGAYINSDPRYVPKFNATTGVPIGPQADSYTGYATGPAGGTQTTITAVQIAKSEPSPEGEILRGVHKHQTVYTLTLTNNAVNPTSGITVDDYIPAGLEFLGCGAVDNTTNAPTNPGSTQEYPGSGPIDPGNAPAAPACIAPTSVRTESVDPDGPLTGFTTGVYTHVQWTGLAALAASGTRQIQYIVGIPIRENTMTWTGTTPTAASLGQTANLDNNSGAETTDEQALTNYATVGGKYNGTTDVSDDDSITRTAEDLAVQKTVAPTTIAAGQISTWKLDIEASEYRRVDNIRIADTVPDGLCPLGSANFEAAPQSAECNPTGDNPSSPYTTVQEQASGAFNITWDNSTDPALARLQPNGTTTITYPTKTRVNYQNNFNDDKPVLTEDSWHNDVTVTGADYAICAPNDPDCTQGGTRIPSDEPDGTDDTDVSSASQQAGGVTIDKKVRETTPLPIDCATGAYVDGPAPQYGPGDTVCWKVRVNFASKLFSGTPRVADFLPPNQSYVSGTAIATGANNVPSTFSDTVPGLLTWNLGTSVASGSLVFEWTFKTTVNKTSSTAPLDIDGNLMKFAYSNTAGTTFPLRDEADITRAEPAIALTKGIFKVNGNPGAGNPANTSPVAVQGGDVVTYRLDLSNTGNRDAGDLQLWDKLPTGITCAEVSSISDSGTCNVAQNRIEWTNLTVPASGAHAAITYNVTIPSGVGAAQTFTNTTGVRTYTSQTNTGGTFRYVPESNIDPNVTATYGPTNADPVGDTATVTTPAVGQTKTRTTEVTQTGNNAASEATIGEDVLYTLKTTIPAGTTLYGSPTLTDDLGSRLTLLPATVTATLNGTALPTAGLTLSTTGNAVVVNFPATYTNAAGSGDDILQVDFHAQIADVAANVRSVTASAVTVPNTATFAYRDQANAAKSASQSVSTTIVEPNVSVVKGVTGDDQVDPGEVVRYTVTARNLIPSGQINVSTANNLVLVDTLPAGLTPVDNSGPTPVVIPDGGTVTPDGGTWDQTARTITWNIASLAPNATAPRRYDVRVDDPANAGTIFTNNAKLTATSLPAPADADGGERGGNTTFSPGYSSTTSHTVSLNEATLDKSVSPASATIGDDVTYKLQIHLGAGVSYFNTTVLDTLGDGMDYDGTTSIVCTAGCPPAIAGNALPAQPQGDGSTKLGWYLGNIAAGPARTVEITYTAHVDDHYEPEGTNVLDTQALPNTARGYYNGSDTLPPPTTIPPTGSFTNNTNQASKSVTVVEPKLAIDKNVSGDIDGDDRRSAQPGDTFTYTVTVTNSGDAPAYDVTVKDTNPDAELRNVVPTDGAGFLPGGWQAGDPLVWTIPGPIAPGAHVDLRYTAALAPSAALHDGDQAVNTADVPSYWGVPAAERATNLFDYRHYTEDPSDVVTVDVALPKLTVAKTTGLTGNPESGDAQIGQPFPWRVVVTNTSAVATAKSISLTDVLPPSWTYVAGSASFTQGSATVAITPGAGGDQLTWSNVTDLAPGASTILTFQATPGTGAAANPNPNQNSVTTTAQDTSGATGSADGPYEDDDTANAVLRTPSLAIEKTPDGGAAVAGQPSSYSVKVTNNGDAVATNVLVHDVLGAGNGYAAGAATASPPAGFSETSVTNGPGAGETTVDWKIASLGAGASVTITVPVSIPASTPDATTLHNTASASSDQRPTPVTDPGSLIVARSADLTISKTAADPSVNAGENITYTLHVANNGPSDASGVVVTDQLPANVTFVSADSPCSEAAGTVTCNLGTLANGASGDYSLVVKVLPSATGSVVNSATVASPDPDPGPGPNTGTETTPITPSADLAIVKTGPSLPVLRGSDFEYTIRVTNAGPSDATAVTVHDVLPSQVSYVTHQTSQGTCTEAAGTLDCNLGTLTPTQEIVITVKVTAIGEGDFDNTATVDSPTPDPTTRDHTSTTPATVLPAIDLSVVKTGPATVAAGADIAYSLVVANAGPSDATGVKVRDTLPAGTTFVSASSGCIEASGVVTCDIGALAAGADTTLQITVRAPVPLAGASLTNTAVVSGNEADIVSENDTSSATTKIGPAADLEVTKTMGAAKAGKLLTYTLVATNHGPSDSTAATVRDTLPQGLSFRSAEPSQGTCSRAGRDITCQLGALVSGGSAQIVITVMVPESLEGKTLENSANVIGPEPDPQGSNNDDTVTGKVRPGDPKEPDLHVTKTASTSHPQIGVPFSYRVTIENRGKVTAKNVHVTDTMNGTLKIQKVTITSGSCKAGDGHISCNIPKIAPGKSVVMVVTVIPQRPGELRNTASAQAANGEVSPADNGDIKNVSAKAPTAPYTLTKTASRKVVPGGGKVRFRIELTTGDRALRNLKVCDRLPAGLVFVAAPRATFESGRACWTREYVPPHSEIHLRVIARAEKGYRTVRVHNVAISTAENGAGHSDGATVKITPAFGGLPGGVTG